MPHRGRIRRVLAVALWALAVVASAAAQDLEPKAYSASPVGAAFVVAGLSRSTGSVVFDPTVPLTDVDANINAGLLATGYTFGLFGKLTLVTAALPYSWGDISGKVFEEARSITRSGLADSRYKLSINLAGNPALRARDFARAPRKTIVGASLTVVAPSGQYDDAKLINLGTNRWAIKPEIGVAVPRGHWDVDAYLGVWLLTDNADYFPGGQTRSQDPVVALQGHVSYTFKPRLWLALDATWYRGGSSTVGSAPPSTEMNNSRAGLTLSIPAGRQQSFKVAWSNGVAVRTGTDFRTLSVGWQWLWLTKR
jgi:hypothetical protein